MIEILAEAVVLSFVIGGIIGAVIALHLRSGDSRDFITQPEPVKVDSGNRQNRIGR